MAAPGHAVLKDVVAYVEVWSSNGTENYSKAFTNQLVDMGAKVSKTFNKQVTHVVFKDGYQSTWDKARKRGIKLVSVLWVERCRAAGVRADESLFPATGPSEHILSLMRKKRKCMQPKDFIPKTPENDKRLQRKFEKMTAQLQRQRTALDDNMPVFLFESCDSLTYSSSIKVGGHQHTMEKRLQEMKEKREHLSPTSSQRTEQAQENPDDTLCEAPSNVSRDILCADEPFAGGSHSSLDELCGNQERILGESVKEMKSDTCGSLPALDTSHTHSLASASCLSALNPQKHTSDLPEEEVSRLRDPGGDVLSPDREQAAGASEMGEEKSSPCPETPASGARLRLHSASRSPSAKRKRVPADLWSPLRETPRRRGSSSRRPAVPHVQLLRSGRGLQFPSLSDVGTPDSAASSYEDYFSPENLQERISGHCPPGPQPSAGPAHIGCRSLSQRERASILETSDLSCIGEKPRSVSTGSLAARAASSLRTPVCMATEDTPAAEKNPGHIGQAECPQGEDAGPAGSRCPHTTPNPAGPEQEGSCSPVQGIRAERGLAGGRSTQKEGPAAAVPKSPVGHTQECELRLRGVQSAEEEKENLALGYSGSNKEAIRALANLQSTWVLDVKNGPTRYDVPDSSWEGVQDLIRRHEQSKKRDKSQKSQPTRTLVMTSMPSEQQSVVMQVVNTLKGFSLAPEVCETTTHVLAGKPLRTLNVLLGIARGCWVLSYEWVSRSTTLMKVSLVACYHFASNCLPPSTSPTMYYINAVFT
ncbi:PREDICTED: microcephalin isoform X3 [Chinchilla lanigera]|uniref:microcephalin isoform X3 n=1 Tax=Chinchilla lanigera TaxID=34839 RepID=UPI000695B828|nr:PREDICTED: microcephalin isoform X3 [Chinchilla lanigera]